MIKDKKLIGVCLTRVQDTTRSKYINQLHKLVRKEGYKLIVFNSLVDFYNNDTLDKGAKAIYDVINYDVLDALVIYSNSFYNLAIVENMVSKAKQRGVPVIVLNEIREGCFSIVRDYKEAYKELIHHVIRKHGARDICFMACRKDRLSTDKRFACFQEAMEENFLTVEPDKVLFGEYWGQPAKQAIIDYLASGRKVPDAVICANDSMAIAVCEELLEHGYRVPEDVIVTGFDGIPFVEYNKPRLTTCDENVLGMAELTMKAVEMALTEGKKEGVLNNKFKLQISESCGCESLTQMYYRDAAIDLFQVVDAIEVHEEKMYNWIDCMLEIKDMNQLYQNLEGCIDKEAFVCLNTDFLAFAMGSAEENRMKAEAYVVIASKENHNTNIGDKMNRSEMVPDLDEWLLDDTLYVLSTIYVQGEECGFYALKTDDILRSRHRIKRVVRVINVACDVIVNHMRQQYLMRRVENASLINSVTKLPNLRGSMRWFEEFAAKEERHNKTIVVSVYGWTKYTYVYENYGIASAEEALCFVAEALKISNTKNSFVGHIAEDTFLVVNYPEETENVGDIINNATSVFFSVMGGYNNNSEKEYIVEVNCGCTVVNSGWDGALESYIKVANSEMYMNRLRYGQGLVEREEKVTKNNYKTFELLMERNLFKYHYQPIVNAKNGEIYAYEALMRTEAGIGMRPLEILDTAKEYGRLYDIEKATMFNILERYTKEKDKFHGCKIFINTIPGHFLKGEDLDRFVDNYSGYMNNVVLELTEDNTVSDEELRNVRRLYGEEVGQQIAIDDYGTGHSNIVNLIRYEPQVIKVDRFLITDIDKDLNKQMFVQSTIDFARINHIMVLAEGVETSEELQMVIALGVDFIQGYYTGKPVAEPILEIAEDIRKEIIRCNALHEKQTT